jgi:hypothetical protein
MEDKTQFDPDSPLFKALELIKDHDLMDEIWLIANMNRISHRFIDLGLQDLPHRNPECIHPGRVRVCMKVAIDEYVRLEVERRRPN